MKEGMLEAARAGSVLEAALLYIEAGISVLPCTGKKPTEFKPGELFPWAKLQVQRVPFSYIHNWHNKGWLANVGIITGAISGNLVAVDLDGEKAVQDWYAHFNYTTFTVLSGSGKGRHVYFYCKQLPPTTRTKGYELRANGCYLVAPPSIHPDTRAKYAPANDVPVLEVENLNDVVQWIKSKIPATHTPAGNYRQREAVARPDEWSRRALQYWHNKALDREALVVRSASKGLRNDALFYATRRLARMEGMSLSVVRDVMLAAASHLAADDGVASVERTIESALRHAENMEIVQAPAPRAPKFNSR